MRETRIASSKFSTIDSLVHDDLNKHWTATFDNSEQQNPDACVKCINPECSAPGQSMVVIWDSGHLYDENASFLKK